MIERDKRQTNRLEGSETGYQRVDMPSSHTIRSEIKRLLNASNIENFFRKKLDNLKLYREVKTQESPGLRDGREDRQEYKEDHLTFGQQSPDHQLRMDQFAAPHFEKSVSMGVDARQFSPAEEKDIPLLRAFSEHATNGLAESFPHQGGFSLVKERNLVQRAFGTPGNGERPSSEFGRTQLQLGLSLNGRRPETKWHHISDELGSVVRNLDLTSEGQHSETKYY